MKTGRAALAAGAILGGLLLVGTAKAAGPNVYTPPAPSGDGDGDGDLDDPSTNDPRLNDPAGPVIRPRGRRTIANGLKADSPINRDTLDLIAVSFLDAVQGCYENNQIPALLRPDVRTASAQAAAKTQTYQCALDWAEANFDLEAMRAAGVLGELTQAIEVMSDVWLTWMLYASATFDGVSTGEGLAFGTVLGKSIRDAFYNLIPFGIGGVIIAQARAREAQGG